MKVELSGLSYEAKWFDFDDCKLKIRPYPASMMNLVVRDGSMVLAGKDSIEIFKHCLTEWKDVVGDDGKPLVLSDEVKTTLYDFKVSGIADFVINKNAEISRQKEASEKN